MLCRSAVAWRLRGLPVGRDAGVKAGAGVTADAFSKRCSIFETGLSSKTCSIRAAAPALPTGTSVGSRPIRVTIRSTQRPLDVPFRVPLHQSSPERRGACYMGFAQAAHVPCTSCPRHDPFGPLALRAPYPTLTVCHGTCSSCADTGLNYAPERAIVTQRYALFIQAKLEQ